MKHILCTLVGLFVAGYAVAQTPITISSSPTIVPGKVDSCNLPTATALSSIPSLTPVINGSWDLGTTALQTDPFTYTYKTKTSGFSTATFSDSLVYPVGPTTGIVYTCWRNVQQSASGVTVLGEEITKRQPKGIGTATGNNLDSIIFAPQVIAFNNSLPIIKFPATMSSAWSASAIRNVYFTVNAFSQSLPAMHRQIRNSLDSVVGWGKMKVPLGVSKPASAWIQVLQVQHIDVAVDSFFVNGAPAQTAILNALSVTQGQSTTVARTFFYRAGAYRPLVEAVHSTPSHSSAASKFYMHAVELPTAIQTIPGVGDVRVYPNPVRGGKLHIEIPNNTKDGWSYSIININGQQISKGQLSLTATTRTTEISLPQALQSGIYYMTLMNADVEMTVLPLTIE